MSDSKNSRQSYPEAVAEKMASAKELTNIALSDLGKVLDPEVYISFLNIIERFHWYSFVNILLILTQFPNAQYLAGFDVWKRTSLATYNDPARRILKPSSTGKGIKLIAPFTVVDNSSRSLVSVAVPVYDVNQVNEVPLPENDFLDMKKCNYVDIINAINFVAPYRTVFASSEDNVLSHNVKGYCNHSLQQFVVDSRLSVRGLLSVLLHEFIVADLHLANYSNTNTQGLVVESVYYILLKHFRIDVQDITFSYIGRFKSIEKKDVIEAFYYIQAIAHSIIEKIEEHLEYMVDLLPAHEEPSYQTSFFEDFDIHEGSMAE